MAAVLRRVALRILQHELEEREEAARLLADEAYQDRGRAGKRGRAWWDGYAHATRAIRAGERSL